MTEEEALSAARDFALKQGRDPARYKTSVMLQGTLWKIDFFSNAEKPAPGDFFSVYLDDRSGAVTRIVPGK